MGTLTSCSFSTVNLRLRSGPAGKDRRGRIPAFRLRKTKKKETACFLCKGISTKEVSFTNFIRIRCFSTNNDSNSEVENNNNKIDTAIKDSNVKTAPPEDNDGKSANDFGSDEPPTSVSSTVHCFLNLGFLLSYFK